ncbi:unnamed protein product [Nezara viridula]|uniref:Uncharacterized protein n=1 Tax=Nezara viridula TaxID=85310 RepID=A0A9P0HQD3_NEZVI|nr:unnamed protein product [Nezara viridula]
MSLGKYDSYNRLLAEELNFLEDIRCRKKLLSALVRNQLEARFGKQLDWAQKKILCPKQAFKEVIVD